MNTFKALIALTLALTSSVDAETMKVAVLILGASTKHFTIKPLKLNPFLNQTLLVSRKQEGEKRLLR